MSFGEKLKEWRLAKYWSQYELAEKSGINRGTIASWEKGRSIPKGDSLIKLAHALGIPIEELYAAAGYTGIEVPMPDTHEQLLEKLRLAQPVSIPVYDRFPIHAGEVHEAPFEYVYLPKSMAARKNLEAYRISGYCLAPHVHDGDIVIVDRERSPEAGNILLCLVDDRLVVGWLEYTTGEARLRNNDESVKLVDCRAVAVVIEVTRRLV